MKKFLVHIENSQYCGIWDDFVAFAESEYDDDLIRTIESQYYEMYDQYGDFDEEDEEDFISSMFYTIEEWDEEIEKDYGNNIPILYDSRENFTN